MSRILLMADCHPEPGYGSGERTLSIHQALTKLAQVDILLVPSPNADISAREGEHIVKLLDNPSMATRWYWIRRNYLLKDLRPDPQVAAMVRRLHRQNRYAAFFGRYHLPILGRCAELGPTLIDVDDVPTDRWSSRIPCVNRLRRSVFQRALAPIKTVFVIKHADISKIRHADVRVLPCISTRPEHSGLISYGKPDNRMLFVGGTNYPPNREGILRFIEKSLPLIRARIADAELRVVGPGGSRAAGPPGVSAENFVPDLTSEYRQAKIFICPIRTGAGALVKLAEAASYGQAIVATSFAARGFDGILQPGRDLLVADSDEAFAEQCVALLRDDTLRARLSRNARLAAAAKLHQSHIDEIIAGAMTHWLAPSMRESAG